MKLFRKTIIMTTAMITLCSSALVANPIKVEFRESISEELPDDPTPKRGNRFNTSSPNDEIYRQTSSGAEYSWYFKHTSEGKRPPSPTEMKFIENHDGYYLGKDEKVIYLTFDAGYENGNVEKILNILCDEQVEGAFFILEHLLLENTELVKRMADEGHLVCNHTAKHKNMAEVSSREEFESELNSMANLYKETLGNELSKFYRPPEGRFSEQNLVWAKDMGYKTVFWSFAYADWDNNAQISPEIAKEKILSETHNGEIILLHPTSATNAEILRDLIKAWREMGYRFGSLSELGSV